MLSIRKQDGFHPVKRLEAALKSFYAAVFFIER